MCSALFIRAPGTWAVRCMQGGEGGRWVMKVSVLYLVTQSRGQLRLPFFFSPELGRTAACRLQSLLSPPTCSLQQGLQCCSEGAEIRSGAVSLSSETLAVHIRLLSFRHIPGYWTNWIKILMLVDSGLWSISLQFALQRCMHSGGIAIGLLPDIIHLLLFKSNLTFLNVIKCETDTENHGENIESKSQCMYLVWGVPHSQVKKILQEKNSNHNQCDGAIAWPWLPVYWLS